MSGCLNFLQKVKYLRKLPMDYVIFNGCGQEFLGMEATN